MYIIQLIGQQRPGFEIVELSKFILEYKINYKQSLTSTSMESAIVKLRNFSILIIIGGETAVQLIVWVW